MLDFLGRSRIVTDLSSIGSKVLGDDTLAASQSDVFDIIIVGGGTAGCVLASRLTEDPSLRVLVLESGGSGQSLLFSRIPSAYSLLFHTKHVYELHTEPQMSASSKRKYWPRGKMLGGCSSINAQMAQYGAPGDFDQWAEISGDESWSWKHFSRYFTKFENYVHNPEYPEVDITKKGSRGPMRIGYFSTISQPSKYFVKACISVGIPYSSDFNSPQGTRGVNRMMTYMDETRQRVSAESAYLTTEVRGRPNLVIAIHAQVTKIIFNDAGTKAVAVEFANSQAGSCYRARSRKEIILSAGAIHSPQILMLSGVGPAHALQQLKIPVIQDIPGVGSNLVDHPVVDLYFKDKLNDSTKFLKPKTFPDLFKVIAATTQYFLSRRGALATNIGEAAAFIRTNDPTLFPPEKYPAKIQDSTSAPDSPDVEIFTTPFAYKEHGRFMFPVHTFSLHSTLLRPISTGNIRLKTKNPWDNPVIDPRYLDAPEDAEKLLRGMRLIMDIARTEPLASRLDHNDTNAILDHQLHLKSDEELKEIIKDRVETLYHPVGTCRMAPLHNIGVVDSHLRVHGVQGLRVCDASIFPSIVSGHTAGAVLAVAEKLSDIIKEDLKPQA
ncbi:hypothetical protein BDZ94DRAFT_1372827 [Collybia nuda]|uniref:Glucose-methanol-choline oxidoreductase N-terminal domain-containing protein n=1 Tax=Collybia nuda TaxID=64659 RepID=A0A9P5YFJ8_9AGAR|nr:hypothetical protein BDZ94DRAFT_1372827 [Collybia nuda]